MCASELHRDLYSIGAAAQDADPARAAAAKLGSSGYPQLRNVRCDFSEGVLSLSGTVPSFHLKQVAQELVSRTHGRTEIRNKLLVTSYRGQADASAAG